MAPRLDVGVVIGSLLIGVTVEQTSYAVGFAAAGAGALCGLAAFVITERRRARPRPVPWPRAGV